MKKGDEHIVQKSDIDGVTDGMKYTGNPDNLYQWYSQGSNIYWYVLFSTKSRLSKGTIPIENKNYSINLYYHYEWEIPSITKESFIVNEYEDCIYIRLHKLDYSSAADTELLLVFNDKIETIKNLSPDKDIIVDLQSIKDTVANRYTLRLLSAILFRNNTEVEKKDEQLRI